MHQQPCIVVFQDKALRKDAIMKNKWRIGGVASLILLATALNAPGEAPPVPAPAIPVAATPSVRKYQAAVATADAERARAIDKARAQLVIDLKAAQKAALVNNDVDGATAVAALAKQYSAAGAATPVAAPDFVNIPWRTGDARFVFKADGTVQKTKRDVLDTSGTWAMVGDRTIVLFLKNGWVDVWTFEPGGRDFKAMGHLANGGYEGKAAP